MVRHILRQKGFSLLELAIAMGIIAVLTSAIVPVVVRSIEIKAAQKTIVEVGIIQDAARKYRNDVKAWPSDLIQMQTGGYLSPLWSLRNAWNHPYVIGSNINTFSVSTDVPGNLVNMLQMRLPLSFVSGQTVTSVIGTGLAGDGVPSGVIVAWSGSIALIPTGWVLCDGNNGTPDLRDKFIVGAKEDEAGVAKTKITGTLAVAGGQISHNHTGFTGVHILTIAEIPSHSHSLAVNDKTTNSGPLYPEMMNIHSLTTVQTGDTGGSQGHRHSVVADLNVPPFYALAYIMKL